MKRIAAVVVLLAAAGAAAYWWFAVRETKHELVLSGSIESRSADVGPLVAGRVKEVFVDEGAAVRAGQSIASLEPDLIDPQIQEQEAQIQAQKAALDKALHGPRSEEIARARVEANVTETNRKRLENLLEQGIAPQQDYDAAAARAKTALETLHELEAGRDRDIASARARSRPRSRLSPPAPPARRDPRPRPPTASSSRSTCAPAISSPRDSLS
jgi:HlyD family secretion protein